MKQERRCKGNYAINVREMMSDGGTEEVEARPVL